MAVDTSPQAAYINSSAQNQATDYERYQAEIAKQKAALEAQKRKQNNIWGKILPLAGTALGAVGGAFAGNPMLGAALGSGVGNIAGSAVTGGAAPGAGISGAQSIAQMAMMGGGKYLTGSPATGRMPSYQDYAQANDPNFVGPAYTP